MLYTYMHVYIYIYTYISVHLHVYAHIHACMHACIYTYVRTYVHTYITNCIHTSISLSLYIYIYIHICNICISLFFLQEPHKPLDPLLSELSEQACTGSPGSLAPATASLKTCLSKLADEWGPRVGTPNMLMPVKDQMNTTIGPDTITYHNPNVVSRP